MNIWNLIVESNTFNFIVMVIILAVLMQKMNVSSLLENLKDNIINKIEMSKSARENAENDLKKAQNAVANLDNEIKESIELTKKNIEGAVKQTLANADVQAQNILKNVQTVIDNEER